MGNCSSKDRKQQETADRREARIASSRKSGAHTLISDETASTAIVSATSRERRNISTTTDRIIMKEKERRRKEEEDEEAARKNPLKSSSFANFRDVKNETNAAIRERKPGTVVVIVPVSEQQQQNEREASSEMGDVELSSQVGRNSSLGRDEEEEASSMNGRSQKPINQPSSFSSHALSLTNRKNTSGGADLMTQEGSDFAIEPIPATYLLPNGKRARRIKNWIEATRTFQEVLFQAQLRKDTRRDMPRRKKKLAGSSNADTSEPQQQFERPKQDIPHKNRSANPQTALFADGIHISIESSAPTTTNTTTGRGGADDREQRFRSGEIVHDLECDSIGSDLSGCSSLSASEL